MPTGIPYIPEVDWSTVVENVNVISDNIYQLTVFPSNVNDANSGKKEVGYFLEDFVGNIYTLSGLNIDSNQHRIEVFDEFNTGFCPQINQNARIFNVTGSRYISPNQDRLDNSARDKHTGVVYNILMRAIDGQDIEFTNDPNPSIPTALELLDGKTYENDYHPIYGQRPKLEILVYSGNDDLPQLQVPKIERVLGRITRIIYDLNGISSEPSGKIKISR